MDTEHELLYNLYIHADEVQPASTALGLLISDEAHQPEIRSIARAVLAKLQSAQPNERGTLELPLTPREAKVTHTAVSVLFDDLGRGEAQERDVLRGILERLPDVHVMRLIEV